MHRIPNSSWGHIVALVMLGVVSITNPGTLFSNDSQNDSPAKPPNILLICVDDLRPELACYGVDYIRSPNIDRLATTGMSFRHHYVQAPTCGASRYAMLTGKYGPAGNGALFQRARQITNGTNVDPSLPGYFRQHNYTTVSVGKVSHHPGGLGGKDWNDPSQPEMPGSWTRTHPPAGPWQHPRGWMHGLADGEIRVKAGEMDVFQALPGNDQRYPDGLSIVTAIKELEELSQQSQPFFLAVGILRPHLPFGAPRKYLEPYLQADLPPTPHPSKPTGKTTWHRSGEFMKYNRWGKDPNTDEAFALDVRKHYAACVSYADAQVGKLLEKLERLGIQDNTVVVLWGDHGWHLGEHAVWGKHTLFEESLRSPLIVRWPKMAPPQRGIASNAIVESIDLFPTLCDITGLEIPSYVDGTSLRSLSEPGEAVSYHGQVRTIRTQRYRFIEHKNGHVELYDHQSEERETRNVADLHPELIVKLKRQLKARLDN